MNPDRRVHYVRVTNGQSVPFTDRYDGIPVTIGPGKSENIPPEMAFHFFGFHEDVNRETMFRHLCKRQGWNTPEFIQRDEATGKTVAEARFDKIRIEPVVYKLVPETPGDPQEPIPADAEIPEDQRPVQPVKGQRGFAKRIEANVT